MNEVLGNKMTSEAVKVQSVSVTIDCQESADGRVERRGVGTFVLCWAEEMISFGEYCTCIL